VDEVNYRFQSTECGGSMPTPRFDDAQRRAPKQAQELQNWALPSLLISQASTACYMYPITPPSLKPTDRYSYRDNNGLWEDVLLMNRLRMGHHITLESFFIFEWIPRSPGLYFTNRGREARAQAENSILKVDDGVIVYDPYGKQSMLDGGVGTYRLKPIRLVDGEYVFVSASSTGVAHKGFPIAIPAKEC
jgi:hypothetical protein